MFQHIKSSESKVKFRHAGDQCIKVLEAAKLAYSYTTKTPSLPRNLALGTFGELPSVINKAKSAIPPLFNRLEVFSSTSDKAKLFAKNFSKKSNLDDSGISLPVFPFKTNLKLYNISVTHKIAKRSQETLIHQRHRDC